MHVHLYERIWMWAATGLIGLFLGAIAVTAVAQAVQPPSHVETVDPETLATHPEFGQPAVTTRLDGSVVVPVVATMCAFAPDPIEVPAQVPVTFGSQRRRDPRLRRRGDQCQRDGHPGLCQPVHGDVHETRPVHDRVQRILRSDAPRDGRHGHRQVRTRQ